MTDTDPRDPDREPVATGDRRDVHYEPDPDQLLVARSTVSPTGALPLQQQSLAAETQGSRDGPPIEEVRITPPEPSVWDARPPADDAEKSGEPTGH